MSTLTLNTLADYLRSHGVPAAYVTTTGGNCHSVVVQLSDGGELLINDEDGPMGNPNAEVTGLVVLWYDADHEPVTTEHQDGVMWDAACGDEPWATVKECAEVIEDTVRDAGLEQVMAPEAVTQGRFSTEQLRWVVR